MRQPKQIEKVTKPDHILSYFKLELWPLLLVTVSGIFYNVGMIAGPYFEGRLAQCLFDIMKGYQTFSAMISLAVTYLAVIFVVQLMRCIKRFYVRRFANDTSLFSQGQFQLLSIARAVAASPEILLLDEITASLDSDTERRILDALERACEGRTVLSISHRLHVNTRNHRIIEIGSKCL